MDNLVTPIKEGIFFDTETTGIPNWKVPSHMPEQPHLTQLAALHVDLDDRRIIQSINVIIRPDGWTIPPECVELNGITTEYAQDVGIPEKAALDIFLEMWSGRMRLAYNTTFDNRIIRIATKRYRRDIVDKWKEGDYECQMIRSKKFMKASKNPKLAAAYLEICGKELTGAHDALVDISATIDLYFAMNDAENNQVDAFNEGSDILFK